MVDNNLGAKLKTAFSIPNLKSSWLQMNSSQKASLVSLLGLVVVMPLFMLAALNQTFIRPRANEPVTPPAPPVSCQFEAKWGNYGSGPGQFINPEGITSDSNGNTYVADYGNFRVQKFNRNGGFVAEWGGYGTEFGNFVGLTDLAINSSNELYVTDYDANANIARIQVFDLNGNFLRSFGTYGANNGQFVKPHSIAIDSANNVYVTDIFVQRLQKFNQAGAFLTKWNAPGTPSGYSRMISVAVDLSENKVFVTNGATQQVDMYTTSGDYLGGFGGSGSDDGKFNAIKSISFDSANGLLFVVDYLVNGRIQVFDTNGIFMGKWGFFGTGDGQFKYASDVVSNRRKVFVTEDSENNRVQKFDCTFANLPTPTPPPGGSNSPVITTTALLLGQVGQSYNFVIEGYDPDPDPYLTFTVEGLPDTMDVSPCAVFSENPTQIACTIIGTPIEAAKYRIKLTITDSTGKVAIKTLPLTVQ